ncbi:MAG: isoprenyl transferase [Actinomycetia bacterium]|nr:isoprenyl transferase [Actinomycetes bacterium]
MIKDNIPGKNIPAHVAIIMDGNGRWAAKRNLPRSAGHKAGVESLREVIAACIELKIRYLTVYSFSSENWKRPKKEIKFLLDLFAVTLRNELKLLNNHGIRLRLIGDRDGIPREILKTYKDAETKTAGNKVLNFNIALNYGSRQEITGAARKICRDVEEGRLKYSDIDTDTFSKYLLTADIPDPDLLIRTGGECRVSNFLLWQISYTELYFSKVLWPDFKKNYFLKAIKEYQKRHRRFGKV